MELVFNVEFFLTTEEAGDFFIPFSSHSPEMFYGLQKWIFHQQGGEIMNFNFCDLSVEAAPQVFLLLNIKGQVSNKKIK